jgi:hypothetical protein
MFIFLRASGQPEGKANTMSRSSRRQHPRPCEPAAEVPAAEAIDPARIAHELAIAALGMAKTARAVGLTSVGFLLESAALEAGARAAAMQWPEDSAET